MYCIYVCIPHSTPYTYLSLDFQKNSVAEFFLQLAPLLNVIYLDVTKLILVITCLPNIHLDWIVN